MTESTRRTGPANLQRGIESVGGFLALSLSKLRFEPHIVNVRRDVIEIDLKSIASLKPERSRFFGFLPLVDNAFAVVLEDGSEYHFTVRKRDHWIEEIRGSVPKDEQA